MEANGYRSGLEGVIAARTLLSSGAGKRGPLIIAGFPLEVLVENAGLEGIPFQFWNGNRAFPGRSRRIVDCARRHPTPPTRQS